MKPHKLGCINAYVRSSFIWKGHHGVFDGTTTGLAKAVGSLGAQRGDTLYACYGSVNYEWCLDQTYIFCDRGDGTDWCSRVWGDQASDTVKK